MNLFSKCDGVSPNYWCTWDTQNFAKPANADAHNFQARDNLTEESLFGSEGWGQAFPAVRKDLLLVLDDGWDVPFGCDPAKSFASFGSHVVDTVRFPSCTGEPQQRLSKLNELAKRQGWKGLGLWVAANAVGEDAEHLLDEEAAERYWRERLRWSHEAGITYWKVDWGIHDKSPAFRRMLTQLGREEAPDLVIEHGVCCPPINGTPLVGSADGRVANRFADMKQDSLAKLKEMLEYSDAFRTYDVLAPMTSITVDRVALCLQQGAYGVLNIEDELYLGAALGCALGVMRGGAWNSLEWEQITKRNQRLTEVDRAVRFQRLAPAFAGAQVTLSLSDAILTDAWNFAEGTTWFGAVVGKKLTQSAPAVIARGTQLPVVQPLGKEKPFVVAALHPNGVFSIAALPRMTESAGWHTPLADVVVNEDCLNRLVGVFGEVNSIRFRVDSSDLKVMVQDMAKDEAIDVSPHVVYEGGYVTLSGALIADICTNPLGDISFPGVLIQMSK